MYGLVNHCIELLITRNFGEPVWEEIKRIAGIEMKGNYAVYQSYKDESTYELVAAAEKVLSVPAGKILELFGEFFYAYCVESGYSAILQSLSSTPLGFLENLDALHERLGNTYVGMRAPSFRCTRKVLADGTESGVYLHYYSYRPGLANVVIGVVRAACWDLFKVKAELKIAEKENLEEGEVCFYLDIEKSVENKQQEDQCDAESRHNLSKIPRLSPATFVNLFPFHILFNRSLKVLQMGTALARLTQCMGAHGSVISNVFEIQRPRLPFTFSNILGHMNTVYALAEIQPPNGRAALRLKGQMILLQEDIMLYIASPSVTNVGEIFNQKLHLSDIPIHDSTRNVLVMSERFSEEYELSQQLEALTSTLQLRYRDIAAEKQKTERLIYAAFPPSIIEDVKNGHRIPARLYKAVTVVFTGILGFQNFCATHEPLDIVSLLNHCYMEFDGVLDPDCTQKVYKVETIADHYVCVSGCPDEWSDHAWAMTELANRLMDAAQKIRYKDDSRLEITIGIHSGEVVAGIIGISMPRFCLFGDTVNTASRTEAFGKKGFVNLTQFTYDCLMAEDNCHSDFQFTFHTNVVMKGKPAPIPVWLLANSTNKTNRQATIQLSEGITLKEQTVQTSEMTASPVNASKRIAKKGKVNSTKACHGYCLAPHAPKVCSIL